MNDYLQPFSFMMLDLTKPFITFSVNNKPIGPYVPWGIKYNRTYRMLRTLRIHLDLLRGQLFIQRMEEERLSSQKQRS